MERVPSSSDLLSRFKTRKVLGMAERCGNATLSKVTQILGEKSEAIDEGLALRYVWYWNYLVSGCLFLSALLIYFFPLTYGQVPAGLFSLQDERQLRDSKLTSELARHYRKQTATNLGVPFLCLSCTMLYSLTFVKHGGLRVAQFASTLCTVCFVFVYHKENIADLKSPSIPTAVLVLNLLSQLNVTFPDWAIWSIPEKLFRCKTVQHTRPLHNHPPPSKLRSE
ncbi:unnamed protein product [Calicophoron daubneyi]|uniref:Tumor protein p53-inducible protein 11 n=1 Tax=Calicophoron daubneyi TaxID=300641 RepID=A0AAV2TM34_CALDB